MRRILLSLLIIIVVIVALREIALRHLQPQQLESFYRFLNANQYRLYSPDSYKIYLNITESPMMYDRAVGVYESYTFDSIRSRIQPGMTFIDVGANKGDYTLFTGHLIGESGKVIAVEPVPENIHWFNKSLAENDLENVTLVDAALSDENGHATFQLGERSGWGSVIPGKDEPEAGTIRVRTVTLDSLVPELELDRVDALKIDVEGGEVEVIRGAEETIDRFRPMIWLDIHADVDVDWLHEFFTERNYRIIKLSTQQEISEFDTPDRVLLSPR